MQEDITHLITHGAMYNPSDEYLQIDTKRPQLVVIVTPKIKTKGWLNMRIYIVTVHCKGIPHTLEHEFTDIHRALEMVYAVNTNNLFLWATIKGVNR